jgi:DNA-binding NarL/FixJ family response regulator
MVETMINVAVVEDSDTIREGLKILINETEGYSCPAAFPKCETLLKNIKNLNPDVLLIDIGLPGMNGIEGIRQVKAVLPELTIIVLTVYEENDLIFDAIRAGASGYIVKKTPPSKFIDAIRDAYQGGGPMSSNIARKVIELFSRSNSSKPGQQKKQIFNEDDSEKRGLTKQEREILNMLVEGHSFKALADSLSISLETVRSSLKNIYKKLHLSSQAEAST